MEDIKPILLGDEDVKEKLYQIIEQMGYSRQELDEEGLTPYIIFTDDCVDEYIADRLFDVDIFKEDEE
jgi:hypothetical protein